MNNTKEIAKFLIDPTEQNLQNAKIKRFKVVASKDFHIYKKDEVIKLVKASNLQEAKEYEFRYGYYLPNQINIEEVK